MKMINIFIISGFLLSELVKADEYDVGLIYKSRESAGGIIYSKKESSGCAIILGVTKTRNKAYIGLDECDTNEKKLESSKELAASIKKIIVHFKLEDTIRTRNLLIININWKAPHWPLINSINNSKGWPKNVFTYLESSNSEKTEQLNEYVKLLRPQILGDEVYLPFIQALELFGCKFDLEEYFADPIYLHSFITKKWLVDNKVFNLQEVNKDIYPEFKEGIRFRNTKGNGVNLK